MPNANLPAVYILATLDTKGVEAAYLAERLRQCGIATRLVDVGCLGEPRAAADIARSRVFAAAGADLARLVADGDRGAAVTAAAAGARALVGADYARGEVAGVLALGGSAGTTIGTAAMRALPWGVPKVMVSTLASGQVRHFVGNKDIFMLNSVVDIAGVNRLSRPVLDQAARAMAGLVGLAADTTGGSDKPLVAATMFGVTTPCVERARSVLEQAGYEVVVFHATGAGGEAMESLVREGLIRGVLDITTTELADELVGGFLSAGPTRLSAAAECGVPQVVSVGATDMVNFYGPESVPEKFRDRQFHQHNANVTLMRTTPAENARAGGRNWPQSGRVARAGHHFFSARRSVGHRRRRQSVRRSGGPAGPAFRDRGQPRPGRIGPARLPHQRSGICRRRGAAADRTDDDGGQERAIGDGALEVVLVARIDLDGVHEGRDRIGTELRFVDEIHDRLGNFIAHQHLDPDA